MSIGAKDQIDKLLVKKYATMKVDNPGLSSMVDPDKIMLTMNDYATVSRNMITLHHKLTNICSKINTASATYRKNFA
jgi:hypothetical protein